MDFSSLGKWIAIAGIALAVIGGLFWLLGKSGLPVGRLPGDIHVERENFSFHFPVVTCILLSIIPSLLLSLLIRFFRK